jgi:hypothetical protein
LPSASVSTRMIVPPGTLASASARTLAAVLPVSGVSSLRRGPHGCRALGAAVELEPELDPDPLAALATP